MRSSQPAGEEFFIGLKRQSREGLFSSFTSDDDDDDDWKWINGEHVTVRDELLMNLKHVL